VDRRLPVEPLSGRYPDSSTATRSKRNVLNGEAFENSSFDNPSLGKYIFHSTNLGPPRLGGNLEIESRTTQRDAIIQGNGWPNGSLLTNPRIMQFALR